MLRVPTSPPPFSGIWQKETQPNLFSPYSSPPPLPRKGQMNDARCIDTNFSLSLPLRLMSNASSIDLLVDLKKIQSQMPQVAFFPLWEIKRFNSPCLSTLIIIISPSSPVVFVLRRFPSPENPLHWLSLSLHPSPTITSYSLSKFSGSFPNLVFVFPIQMWGERRRAAVQIIISRRQGCYWDAMKLADRVWSSQLQKDNESLAAAYQQCVWLCVETHTHTGNLPSYTCIHSHVKQKNTLIRQLH